MATTNFRFPGNPFITIPLWWRWLIVCYFLIWKILPQFVNLVTGLAALSPLRLLLECSNIAIQLLLLYPFLRERFLGSPIGWLHPLTFSTLYLNCSDIFKDPALILAPFSVAYQEFPFAHPLIQSWSAHDIWLAELKSSLMSLCAIGATYLGFAAYNRHIPLKPANQQIRRDSVFLLIFIVSVSVLAIFIQQRGGIVSHMLSLAFGRYKISAESGHFFFVARSLPYLFILWFFYNSHIIKKWYFPVLFIASLVLQFMVSGSRSGLVIPPAALLTSWSLIKNRFFGLKLFALGIAFYLMIGPLGTIRNSGLKGELSYASLLNTNLIENLTSTKEELVLRDQGTSMAVASMVPEHVSHLLGETYVSAIFFWVPRSIWPSKPRGVGAQIAARIYEGNPTADQYDGPAFPVPADKESFLNFGWPGVFLIFFIYGVFVRIVCNGWVFNPNNPFAGFLLILTLFEFSSPSSDTFVPFMQIVVYSGIILFFLRFRLVTR